MQTSEDIVLGIDVGGSHITLALVDLAEKKLLKESHYRTHVNSWGSVNSIIDAWVQAITDVHQKAGIAINRIGIAMPGPFDYENGVSYIKGNNKYDSLYGLNIKELLAEKLGIDKYNIRMLNDAAAFLQGEAFSGAAKDHHKAVGVTLGTGLGSAVCTDGTAVDAELWNSLFKNSIVEEYISTRWFVKRYFELSGLNILDVQALSIVAKESAMAKAVFNEFAENLGLFLTDFISKEQADVVIVGGNITKASPLFFPALNRYLHAHQVNVPIYITELGENAAVIGAASCWLNSTVGELI